MSTLSQNQRSIFSAPIGGGAPGFPCMGPRISGNVNTGGGGGATAGVPGHPSQTGCYGGDGGSGIVIISYPGPQRAIGGNAYFCNDNTIHCFTVSGNLCFTSNWTNIAS